MVLIEPDAELVFRKLDVPTRRVDFTLAPAGARDVSILAEEMARCASSMS